MTTQHSVSEQIVLVERKLEVRRMRTRRHWHEVQADVHRIAQRSARWTPLVGVAAVAVVAFRLARQRGAASGLAARRAGTTGVWASVLALATTALRFALSPQARGVWNAWRRRRAPS